MENLTCMVLISWGDLSFQMGIIRQVRTTRRKIGVCLEHQQDQNSHVYRRSLMGWSGLVLLGLIQGCTLSESIDEAAPNSFSSSFVKPDDAQSKIGEKEHPVVLAKYGGEYRNKEAETLVAIIVGRLVAASEDKQQIYKITLLNTPKVNAFALPGGYLYVTRGLLSLANDTSELAAVIASGSVSVENLRNAKHSWQKSHSLFVLPGTPGHCCGPTLFLSGCG